MLGNIVFNKRECLYFLSFLIIQRLTSGWRQLLSKTLNNTGC